MRYRWRDFPSMLATAAGRSQIGEGVRYRMWPVSSRLARAYRRTVVRGTHVVAVVGSSGKSTTVRAIAAALGIVPSDTQLHNAWGSISRAMLGIVRGQPNAVVEVGIADKGQMERYSRVVLPDVAVVTSIGSEHHRSLGTLDVTRDEKAWMVRALPAGGSVVLNADDANVMWMRGETRARVVTFGIDAECDVRATDVRIDWPRGTRFRIVAFGQERDAEIRLLGRHMVRAALAAVAVAHLEGVSVDDALARLAGLAPTPGRLQAVELSNGATLLRDDYKAPVETIDAALDVLEEIPARRRIVVLGEISEPPNPQHATYRRIAERVGRIATHFFVAGRMMKDYRPGAHSAGMPHANIVPAGETPRETAAKLEALLEPGDVVLVKGRDTQRLARICLVLQGRTVRCDIRSCHLRAVTCDACPMLERGWGSHRVVM